MIINEQKWINMNIYYKLYNYNNNKSSVYMPYKKTAPYKTQFEAVSL